MSLLKCLAGIAITFVLTTSVAAEFAFTPEQAGDIVRAYDDNTPDPITDDAAASGRGSAEACQNGTGDSETCGAGLCTHVQATYLFLKNIADCTSTFEDEESKDIKKAKIDACKGQLGQATNIFKPLEAVCRCDGATTC
jgi:hypothetical protein